MAMDTKQPHTRDELISYCRYYKGEEKSPWEGVCDGGEAQNKNMLWWYECIWVRDMMSGCSTMYDSMVREYVGHGLESLGAGDGVPITLKALLCNRYGKTAWDVATEFTAFYIKYYSITK